MSLNENLLKILDLQAGPEKLLKPLERMFLDHCYRHATNFSHDNSDVISAYEEIKNIIEVIYNIKLH